MQLLNQPKILILIVVSLALIWISRRSLTNPRSHGFYRFFAWEAILVLILINADNWFTDWLCLRQIVSWLLLALSTYMVTWGALTLYRRGKPNPRRTDPTLTGIEKTTELVTTGIYRYIRHPIYGAAVVGVWGVVLKDITLLAILLALATVLLFTITAKIEEMENIRYFGEEYQRYRERTRMFVPFVF